MSPVPAGGRAEPAARSLLTEVLAEEAALRSTCLAERAATLLAALGEVRGVLVGDLAVDLVAGGGRPPVQVEVLVRRDDVPAAVEAFEAAGWRSVEPVPVDDLVRVADEAWFAGPSGEGAADVLRWAHVADDLADGADDGVHERAADVDGLRVADPTDLLVAVEALLPQTREPLAGLVESAAALRATGRVDDDLLAAERATRRLDRPRGAYRWYVRHRARPTWGPLDAPGRLVTRYLGVVAQAPHGSWSAHVRVARSGRAARHLGPGDPMNAMPVRRAAIRRLARLDFDRAIETGTWEGRTTAWLNRTLRCPVWTIEVEPGHAAAARERFARNPDIHPLEGDSPVRMAELVDEFSTGRTFFYLDAHWQAHLPLWDELDLVFAHTADAVVVIDDFAVPGDDGYGYDDYGPGQVLADEDLAPHLPAGWTRWFPVAPSTEEIGGMRGYVVLAPEALDLSDCLLRRA